MDIDARIKRRQRRDEHQRLIEDYESLSPVAHIDEPSNRGPVLEQLLDHLEPIFQNELPPNAYVHGPFGSGKSAIITALFSHLRQLATKPQSIIYTSTRADSRRSLRFVYVDMRGTTSKFAFYHNVLNGLVDDSVPEYGISTEEISTRLHRLLEGSLTGVVIAVDHVDEPNSIDADTLVDIVADLPSNVSWMALGRPKPDEIAVTKYTATSIHVDRYRRQMLVDVLMTRASSGFVQQALSHELARQIAEWADGNAHDALATLFIATDYAERADRLRLTESDITAAIDDIPQPSVSLGRVLVLPENKQIVLRELVDLPAEDRNSVGATTEAISAQSAVDLSAGTVKRFLYEMAETGIIERVESGRNSGKGRPPSRVELCFPPTAFRRLYDLQQ